MATEERAGNWHERDYARRFVYGELPIPYLHMEEFAEAATSVAILFAEHVASLAVAPPSGETPALLTTAKEREAAAYAGEGLYAEGFNAGSWNNDFVARLAKDCIALAAAPQTGGWIATAERLPEYGRAVLVWHPDIVEVACLQSGDDKWYALDDDPLPVTHWMALPQPPGKEGQ